MQIIFHRLAVVEFIAARRWYARRSLAAEARFVSALDDAIRRIERTPQLCSLSTNSFRWVRLRRYPYLVHYEPLDAQTVQVYAVGHAHRRPGYWLKRRTRP